MKKQLLLAATLLMPAISSMGAGFQLNLQGLRQLAMGGGGTAWPWDAATVFYNPGGLTRLQGIQAYGGALLIIPKVRYVQSPTGGYSYNSVNQVFTPFNLYVGGPVRPGSRLAVGIGVYTPFGSGLKWDDDWTGRYVTQSIALQSIFVQPTVAYRINDVLSVGAGFVYAFGHMELNQAIPLQDLNGNDGKAELSGKAHGIGYNVGIQLKANENLQFGISYRSQVDMEVEDGTAKFSVPASTASFFPASTGFTASLPLPQVLSVGVGYRPWERWTLQADFNLVGWKAYDTLSFDYEENTARLEDTHAPRLYMNKMAIRGGAHYQASDMLALMGGIAWDPSPVRDGFVTPDLPDADRLVLTAGLSIRPSQRLTILAAVEYVNSAKRESVYEHAHLSGRYQTRALTPGLGITYDFR